MKHTYVFACIRAALVGGLVVFLLAHLVASMSPDIWMSVSTSAQLMLFICSFALAYPLCLRRNGWLVTLLVIGSYSFAQLASTAPADSGLARWLWIGFL